MIAAWSLLLPAAPVPGVRYFVASPFKTATTTVGCALLELGAGSSDLGHRRGILSEHGEKLRQMGRSINHKAGARVWIDAHRKDVRRQLAHLKPLLLRHDVFSDAPFGHSHIHPFLLRALVPKARFIWVNRDRKSWFASVRAWELAHPEVHARHRLWLEDPDERRRLLRRLWSQRHARFCALKADFPQDCLELDLSELGDWSRLAAFCGRPAPEGAPKVMNVNERESG